MRVVQVASGGGGAAEDYILIREEQVSGVNGGTFTAGFWQTRTLNTEVSDTGNHASLAANQITLAAGTYKVKGWGLGYIVNKHKIKLRNITDGVDLVIGSNAYAKNSYLELSESKFEGRIILASSKLLELQHYCQTTQINTGFGINTSFGVIEVYSTIEFWKE